MRIVFCSSYFNHHQQPLSENLVRISKNYFYIATKTISKERQAIGYGKEKIPDYVMDYVKESDRPACIEKINEADVLIVGSCPESIVKSQIRSGKPIFRYAERPLRNGIELLKYIPRVIKWHNNNPSWANLYLLCASAYTASDYAKFGLFKNRAYKWGYFPQTVYYDTNTLMANKDRRRILWCGRFLDLKHPDDVIRVAKMLKDDGHDFYLDFIGMGPMEQTMKVMITEYGLDDQVHILGAMTPSEVRSNMENAGIYLFTSDQREGWGAVLNESMNSGCAVVSGHAIGATPYLIQNDKNGYVYTSGNIYDLYEKVKYLLDNSNEQIRVGLSAYKTIVEEWNAEVAAKRLVNLFGHIINGDVSPDLYESGPCSKA